MKTTIGDCTIHTGDSLTTLKTLPDCSIHCCVTSPPYFALRDYGHAGQIGLEATPEAYVAKLVELFREVRRVLRDDGTLWLNLGDSYASDTQSNRNGKGKSGLRDGNVSPDEKWNSATHKTTKRNIGTLKPKDIIGIPWRVAFALQADGWWLRQDIIWSKPNPMPESVTDRCTKAHEYIFLLAKSASYYYDAEAVKEKASGVSGGASFGKQKQDATGTMAQSRTYERPEYATRNRRSVWTVTTQPYKGAHFATYPTKLIEPCILAGCPEGGTVLDPFNGAATTGIVSIRHGRKYIGCELNPDYVALSVERIEAEYKTQGLFGVKP